MHVLQLQIGLRAAKLLSVGGLMVYSTCSFNPVENEAVVAQVYSYVPIFLSLSLFQGIVLRRGRRAAFSRLTR